MVPPGGGPVSYGATLSNNTGNPHTLHAWDALQLPNGQIFSPLVHTRLTLPVGTWDLFNLVIDAPGLAPPGVYVYHAYLGFYNQQVVVAQDHFSFTKTGAGAGVTSPADWSATPWTIAGADTPEDALQSPADHPSNFVLQPAHPNPFNPSTTISVTLPEVSELSVAVFAATGQRVAELAHSAYSAGQHSFEFDGSSLASGVYFVHAVVPGRMSEVRKLILIK